MRIVSLETFLTNAGRRNYCFLRLKTNTGLAGIGEASLEWQERATEALIHELFKERHVLGADPFDVESLVTRMIRDQYQGGAVAMTAISGIEIACWDIIGKATGQPVYKLLGGRCHDRLRAYANGWYGGAVKPEEWAERARAVAAMGYRGLKFDPFRTAWRHVSPDAMERAVTIVRSVRGAVGDDVELMLDLHGRFAVGAAHEVVRVMAPYAPTFIEEPVAWERIDFLTQVKRRTSIPLAAGERLYMLAELARLVETRAITVLNMDVAHCGGILMGKKIAALAEVNDVAIAPHVSIGPVALAAALHLDMCCTNFFRQENFGEHDVRYRDDLVGGWNPFSKGYFQLDETPGLGLELDDAAIAAYPYEPQTLPCLWEHDWVPGAEWDFTSKSSPGTREVE